MESLEVNTYINAAEEALHEDPEYRRIFDALVAERIRLRDDYGADYSKIEGILFELWNLKIGYMLDNKDAIGKGERPSYVAPDYDYETIFGDYSA
jgi:hypothetical protein